MICLKESQIKLRSLTNVSFQITETMCQHKTHTNIAWFWSLRSLSSMTLAHDDGPCKTYK
jgi:hypothetical protein